MGQKLQKSRCFIRVFSVNFRSDFEPKRSSAPCSLVIPLRAPRQRPFKTQQTFFVVDLSTHKRQPNTAVAYLSTKLAEFFYSIRSPV